MFEILLEGASFLGAKNICPIEMLDGSFWTGIA
jgi:hypothetical protein